MKKLTLGFSTVIHNYERVNKALLELNDDILNAGLAESVCVLAVVQFAEQTHTAFEGGVKFVFTTESGLSRSRNRVISEAESSYFWVLDDDVLPTISDIQLVLKTLEISPVDICIGQIRCSERVGDYKDYSKSRAGKLGLLRVSSIEIVVSREFVLKAGVKFNEKLGLGSTNPTGEENCFLLDVYNAGAKIGFINEPIIAHPCFDEERIIRTQQNLGRIMVAKGYIARKVGGVNGLFLAMYWQLKFFVHYKRLSVLPAIAKGYLFRNLQ